MKRLAGVIQEVIHFLLVVVVTVGTFWGIYHYVAYPFQVEGQSMEPSLSNGQEMILSKCGELHRFDIVIFPDPEGSEESYIKRLIGLPGDVLQFAHGELYINGEWVDEPYLEPLKSQSPEILTQDFSLWEDLGVGQVPTGHVFVLGDNRLNSGDSRSFGFVSLSSIEGKAVYTLSPKEKRGRVPSYEVFEEDNSYHLLRSE